MTILYTVGHSNRSADDLLTLLSEHQIEILIDIRAFPRSRRYPHFDRGSLQGALSHQEIDYLWLGNSLGGFRKPVPDSPHTALTDTAFRGFADYMGNAEYHAAVTALIAQAAERRSAIMCAELQAEHCHRQFIADDCLRRGIEIRHLSHGRAYRLHTPNPCLDNSVDPPRYNRHEQGDLFPVP